MSKAKIRSVGELLENGDNEAVIQEFICEVRSSDSNSGFCRKLYLDLENMTLCHGIAASCAVMLNKARSGVVEVASTASIHFGEVEKTESELIGCMVIRGDLIFGEIMTQLSRLLMVMN